MSNSNTIEVTRDVVQRGLQFEECEVRARYLHRLRRTVTETDNVLFIALTMSTQPLHLDMYWSNQQPGFGDGRLVSSMWTLSTVVGLSVGQPMLGTIVANLDFTEMMFPTPMFHDGTPYTETVCRNK